MNCISRTNGGMINAHTHVSKQSLLHNFKSTGSFATAIKLKIYDTRVNFTFVLFIQHEI